VPAVSQARRKAWTWIVQNVRDSAGNRKAFTAKILAEVTGMNLHTTKRFIQFLLEKKRLRIQRRGHGPLPTQYILIDGSPLEFGHKGKRKGVRTRNSRPKGSARQRAWNSVRILKLFTLSDIQATSGTAYVTCSAYVGRLERAGLVRKVRTHSNQECALFRLNKDVGHMHPIVREDGVYCPSIDEFYPYKSEKNNG